MTLTAWTPRINIPSASGRYSRILSDDDSMTRLLNEHGEANYQTVQVAIVAWVSLLGDSPFDVKPNIVIDKFRKELINDYKGVSQKYSDLSDQVARLKRHDHDGRAAITGDFLDGFKDTPIFREYLEFHRTGNPLLLRYILSFLTFGSKIRYHDLQLNTVALREWYEIEEKLKASKLPAFTQDLRYILNWMFSKGWDQNQFLPKHGNGSVAEKGVWGSIGKNRAMKLDGKLSYLYERVPFHTEELCLPTPTGERLSGKDVGLSVARLEFVPKNLKKTRSICMEPVDFQWAQQGVRIWYEHWLRESVLGKHVFLKDQTFNQVLCWHGSISSELATIDLSSASDSVSLRLVKAIFPPKVLKHLVGTRSRYVRVPERKDPISVEKFAPMGSALCFPVQCTVFSAVCLMVSIAQSYGRDVWNGDTITDLDLDYAYFVTYGNRDQRYRHYRPFFVYGDDIIIDNKIVSNVVRSLQLLSFKVNEEKSFVDEVAYRESCGKHYFNGYDVTPLKLKLETVNSRISLDAAVGVVDAANRAAEYGYKNLYSVLVNVCLRYPIEGFEKQGCLNPILFVPLDSQESFALKSRDPRNNHLRRRDFCRDFDYSSLPAKPTASKWSHQLYQRDELQSITVSPKTRRSMRRGENFDAYYHGLWWRARYGRKMIGDDLSSSTKADTKEICVRWRWTAA